MSGSNDNLKSMFQEAFAAEQIPVDMGAWGQMEMLLDKRKPLGFAFWTWIPAIFIAAGLASWLAFTSFQVEIYQPRNSNTSFEALNIIAQCDSQHLWESESLNDSKKESEQSKFYKASDLADVDDESVDTSPVKSTAISNVSSNKALVNAIDDKTEQLDDNLLTSNNANYAVNLSEEVEDRDDGPMQMEPTSTNNEIIIVEQDDFASKTAIVNNGAKPIIATDERLDIRKMPLAHLSRFDSAGTLLNVDSKPITAKTEYLPSIYIKAGVNKSFDSFTPYSGFGQTVGIGYMRQIKHHLILSGELNGSRLHVGDTAMISGETAYGFKRFQNEYVVTTTELIRFNATLMAHYRMKRFYVGGGLQPWILCGLKNTTEQVVENTETSTPVETTEGYFQWDRYNRTGLNAVVDAQYQIMDDTFIGIRGAYGVTNSLNVDYKAIRLLEIQAYLKLNIR